MRSRSARGRGHKTTCAIARLISTMTHFQSFTFNNSLTVSLTHTHCFIDCCALLSCFVVRTGERRGGAQARRSGAALVGGKDQESRHRLPALPRHQQLQGKRFLLGLGCVLGVCLVARTITTTTIIIRMAMAAKRQQALVNPTHLFTLAFQTLGLLVVVPLR